ncbi:MAG: hypothetical protein OXC07_11120 [Kistimonas sp.]|nr:hypothetical protein [Kistimonas sp.]
MPSPRFFFSYPSTFTWHRQQRRSQPQRFGMIFSQWFILLLLGDSVTQFADRHQRASGSNPFVSVLLLRSPAVPGVSCKHEPQAENGL